LGEFKLGYVVIAVGKIRLVYDFIVNSAYAVNACALTLSEVEGCRVWVSLG